METAKKEITSSREEVIVKGRPDYYPFNEKWLDTYFEKWVEEEDK